MKRLYFIASFVFIFAIFTYGIMQWQAKKSLKQTSISSEIMPDFIAEQLESRIYNKKGTLSHIIHADRMEHYTELAVTYFEQPKYTLYPKNKQAAWHISAKEGILNQNNRVRLENRVLLKSSDTDSLIQEVHGKYIELDLTTNIISSDQTIMIQGKDFTMYGSGLIVDLNTTQMTMTEHVQTVYKKNSS